MIHVLLASTVPLLVFFAAWWRRGRRTSIGALVALPLVCMALGAWAVVPDLPRLRLRALPVPLWRCES